MSAQPLVFPIRPKYVERIIGRRKDWELRKSRPGLSPYEMILIYETAPRSMIVATAEVDRIIDTTPAEVWLRTGKIGVTRKEFDAYYGDRSRAVALHLVNIVKLAEPRPLPEGMAPPQRWSRYKGVWP